jgi:hypothetical protein
MKPCCVSKVASIKTEEQVEIVQNRALELAEQARNTFAELKKQFQEEHLSYPRQEAYQKLDELLEAYKKELLEEHRCFGHVRSCQYTL